MLISDLDCEAHFSAAAYMLNKQGNNTIQLPTPLHRKLSVVVPVGMELISCQTVAHK